MTRTLQLLSAEDEAPPPDAASLAMDAEAQIRDLILRRADVCAELIGGLVNAMRRGRAMPARRRSRRCRGLMLASTSPQSQEDAS